MRYNCNFLCLLHGKFPRESLKEGGKCVESPFWRYSLLTPGASCPCSAFTNPSDVHLLATQVVVDKVNDDINLPLVSESREERIIEKLVDKLMPKVEPALHAIMPTVYVTCIKMALDERLSLKERRERISDLLRAELAEPLSRELNERVDCSMVPEGLEGKVLKIVANKVIDEFVEWTVGEVSYKLA